jgi:hypothetical protein
MARLGHSRRCIITAAVALRAELKELVAAIRQYPDLVERLDLIASSGCDPIDRRSGLG